MVIDPSKVNLKEKDIEDYLYHDPGSVLYGGGWTIHRWLARQYKVNSGIIDLLGCTGRNIVVVEVKNVDIDEKAITQVCRYVNDIREIANNAYGRHYNQYPVSSPIVYGVLVGPSISRSVFRDAEALGVYVNTFFVNLTIETTHVVWGDAYAEQRKKDNLEASFDEIFATPFSDEYAIECESRRRICQDMVEWANANHSSDYTDAEIESLGL